ncbi:DUF1559 family PulG-like putative transporter [Allorhodopirellula solitaria]|uniref:DUF1559 domain-containing protein n=1 Tax=Allorhodopirellula solitaria TaxID=2527987 RepID=A0A5C5XPG9_9BACT|nr:DUF1559 domain-containing protein [Allorhodopirellula solitaria]TWT64820.1 hypothetical protein CA85_36050 [Allorhodopirellula solitaria]
MSRHRHAFTLVELLVVIAIIGVLVGLAAPAVQSMRESSRRAVCQSRLTAIGMAVQSYHDRWQHYPVGTVAESGPIESVAQGDHHNWLGRLLELMDQPVIESHIDRSVSIYDSANAPVLKLSYVGVHCPSATNDPDNASNYVGLHSPVEKPIDESDLGVFVLNEPISRDDVTDGLANTAFVSEKLSWADDLGWLSGTRATLRNVGGGIVSSSNAFQSPPPSAVGSIGSHHPGGVHVLFGSGEIRFQSTQTNQQVLEQIANRQDGQLPLEFQPLDALRQKSVE